MAGTGPSPEAIRERPVELAPWPSRSRWLGPPLTGPAARIVSLVPSLTESVFELGEGDRLVGRTDWCVSPVDGVAPVPSVGGTKNPAPEAVRRLEPDLVLANREENTRARVHRLAMEVPVLLTDPLGPEDVPALWCELGAVCGAAAQGRRLADRLARDLASGDAGAVGEAHPRVVYWIWRDPWMAAGRDTYVSRLLAAAGLQNALPSEMSRYPRVDLAAVRGLEVAAHLFASEPYEFQLPRDLDAFGPHRAENDAWRLEDGSLALPVDGRLLSWYPSRTAAGLAAATALRRRLEAARP